MGNSSRHHITQIKSDNSFTSDPLLIFRNSGQTLCVSLLKFPLPTSFLAQKFEAENIELPFDVPQHKSLNLQPPCVSSQKLSITIHKNLKNVFPGLDNIHATMLKNLHPDSADYLLLLFNSILSQNV